MPSISVCENLRKRERALSYGSVKQIVKDSKEWTNLGVNSFLLYMEMEYSCEAHQVFYFLAIITCQQ